MRKNSELFLGPLAVKFSTARFSVSKILLILFAAVLVGCGKGAGSSVQSQCDAATASLDQIASLTINSADSGTLLESINTWMMEWDNTYQIQRAMGDYGDANLNQFASACVQKLDEKFIEYFSDAETLQRINALDLSEASIVTQHVANKLRQQFIYHGAQHGPDTKSKIVELHKGSAVLNSNFDTGEMEAIKTSSGELSQLIGFPDMTAFLLYNNLISSRAQLQGYIEKQTINSTGEEKSISLPSVTVAWPDFQKNLFSFIQKMWGIEFVAAELELPYQSQTIQGYTIFENGQSVGELFMDIYVGEMSTRPWSSIPLQRGVSSVQKPIFLIGGSLPSSQLNLDQIRQVLHQFGHFLHHQFSSEQKWFALAGISVEPDFIEAPAFWLEQWAWHAQGVKMLTGKQLQGVEVEALLTARKTFYQNTQSQLIAKTNAMLEFFSDENAEQARKDFNESELNQLHCHESNMLMHQCLIGLDGADLLLEPFIRFGLDDVVSAKNIREQFLSKGGERPALDMVSDYVGRPITVSELGGVE